MVMNSPACFPGTAIVSLTRPAAISACLWREGEKLMTLQSPGINLSMSGHYMEF